MLLFSARNIVKLCLYNWPNRRNFVTKQRLPLKKLLLFFTILCSITAVHAQQGGVYTEKDYAHKPVWISMIKDTTANFIEIEKAYKIYFEHHAKPGGEHDVIGEHAKAEKMPSKREQRKLQADDHMRLEVKKYEHWHAATIPYVQSDGSILTPAQRLQIWKDHRSK